MSDIFWSNEVVDSGGREREREAGRQSMLILERERDTARQSISTTLFVGYHKKSESGIGGSREEKNEHNDNGVEG